MNTIAKRCRIVVIDDSRIFREAVVAALMTEQDMEVVGAFESADKAMVFLSTNPADVVTLDVEMPGMDGLAFLSAFPEAFKNRPANEIPGVIMVSAHTRKGADITIKALQAGAFDFINKPAGPEPKANQEALKRQLLVKIRCLISQRSLRLCQGKAGLCDAKPIIPCNPPLPESSHKDHSEEAKAAGPNESPGTQRNARRAPRIVKAVVIGVSTGGPKALATLLPDLCQVVSQPILIVQHMPPDFTRSLAESLSRLCSSAVAEGLDGEEIRPGRIYIAPGGRQMTVRRSNAGAGIISLNDQPPENGCRPSVDVLFRTAAAAWGGQTLAIMLTGMGSDGTRGMGALKRAGCYAIAQDEESSVVWGMPGSVVRAGLTDEVLPLTRIANASGELCNFK